MDVLRKVAIICPPHPAQTVLYWTSEEREKDRVKFSLYQLSTGLPQCNIYFNIKKGKAAHTAPTCSVLFVFF